MPDLSTLLLFCTTCFCGSILQTVCGFGFGIFVMMLFPYFMPSNLVSVSSTSLMSFSNNLSLIARLKQRIRPKLLLPAVIGFSVSSLLAIVFLAGESDQFLKKCLAVILILLSVYFSVFSSRIRIAPTPRNGVLAGLLSGILGGLFGMGGPPIVVYLLSATGDNEEYLANTQLFFAFSNVYSTAVRAISGLLPAQSFLFALFGIPVVLLGTAIGRKLFNRLNPALLKKLVYAFMLLSGFVILFS